ncbi:uncharacterized protein H6S33_010404 [Morchella sextelata]|uniref:uncharacterized protein n=1 Tax=Morchella sextelata TaxID=1174677 RepID=UPI001D049DAF|nr:uncharacterized protein H6S33_010404 [Morchella sextelata]KAH0612352.1 hypothetical protein H6S33_010404 [Morchella sextelata]
MVAPAVVVASSPVDISSSSNQQGKPLVIRQPTQHYPHRPILEAPLAFLPTPCHLEIPPPFKGAGGRPVCDSAACSATDSDVTPPTTPALTTATTATTTTTTTTNITTNNKDNKMKFSSSTSNSSSASSSYTHGDSHFPSAHPEPIPYLPNHHHHHHHHHEEEEEEEEEEREQEHQCELAHQEEEYVVPWQEEMRRVEAARYRRDQLEAKRIRQAAQRKLQQQQQKQQQQPRQWVWVVDEEIEAVREADVIVSRNKGFSWGGRVKDAGGAKEVDCRLLNQRINIMSKRRVDFFESSCYIQSFISPTSTMWEYQHPF